MTGIDGTQKGVRLWPAQFAQDDAIWPHPERSLQKIFARYTRLPQRSANREQADAVGVIPTESTMLPRVLIYAGIDEAGYGPMFGPFVSNVAKVSAMPSLMAPGWP